MAVEESNESADSTPPIPTSASDSPPKEASTGRPADPPSSASTETDSSPKKYNDSSRDHAGSSRTKYYAPSRPSGASISPAQSIWTDSKMSEDTQVTVTAANDIKDDDDDTTLITPYRAPEAVLETDSDETPGHVPAVIAEHPLNEFDNDAEVPSRWSESSTDFGNIDPMLKNWGPDSTDNDWGMDLDSESVKEKPQIGPGILPRRWLKLVHQHELVQPRIKPIPKVDRPKPSTNPAENDPTSSQASTSSSAAPSIASIDPHPAYDKIYTLDDVRNALPGGSEGHQDWYFCPTCWAWLRVVTGQGILPHVEDMGEWNSKHSFATDPDFEEKHAQRSKDWSRFSDLQTSRTLSSATAHHLHEFESLLEPSNEVPISRIDVHADMDAFPHTTFGIDEDDELYAIPTYKPSSARLWASCSSDLWMMADKDLLPGQLPAELVRRFTTEKTDNPNPGASPQVSAKDAWELISTLLYNPLFTGQRGWVKLDNRKFANKIGTSFLSSRLLRQIGFGCRQEENVSRVGPFVPNGEISAEQTAEMDRYMMRAWVEIGIYLSAYLDRNELSVAQPLLVSSSRMEDVLGSAIELGFYPRSSTPFADSRLTFCHDLGITKFDIPSTVEKAYNLQVADDAVNTKIYLSALENLSEVHVVGRERLQMKVATERSLGRYTHADLMDAYAKIGFTRQYADDITVEPHEAPESHILELHKRAIQAATAIEKRDISDALALIGRDRDSEEMIKLGASGETFMSLDDAYAALSAPKDSIDDGLIMQYQLAVSDFPGKTEHYRNCLSIIANAPGEERPGIQTFLETGKQDGGAPARKDIPVGLQNIGNTCYLNSILQYIYSIKPLREAVLAFEQDVSVQRRPMSQEEGRSRRFVRQLRLLFLQLYESDQTAVRPDEELAYLAITRPEVDQLVEAPPVTAPASPQKRQSILDSIPTIPSESSSSTRVASPAQSDLGLDDADETTNEPMDTDQVAGADSVLGKRASTDRDDSSRSSAEHSRLRSEDAANQQTPEGPGNEPEGEGYFSLIPKDPAESSKVMAEISPRSPSALRDIQDLNLRSSSSPAREESKATEEKFEPPSVPPPLPPRPHVDRKDTLASGLRFGLQQDSAEVLINVLSQMEMGLSKAKVDGDKEQSNLIQELFSCKYRQQLFYENSSGGTEAQTPVESVFVHPIVGVEEEGKDLYDCLAELYLGGADIEYEGKKGYMMDLMDEFPPFLYIQMRRSQFDLTTGRERKLNTHIAFDQTLAMDRYLVNADKTKRQESIALTRTMTSKRARLQYLRNHKPLSIPETFRHVRESLGTLSEDPDLAVSSDFLEALDGEREAATAEILELERQLTDLKAELEALWTGSQEYEYELVAVFMHRGRTSGAGHYWTYQAHLPDHSDEFFKYNDETVTVVPRSEVLQDRTGSDANPALLCYVRKDRNLVDTLHRRISEQTEEVTMDTEMAVGETVEHVENADEAPEKLVDL